MGIEDEMQTDYPLIPISEISDEARLLAVRWHENATNWIGDKHKLASDIMNYARRFASKQQSKPNDDLVKEMCNESDVAFGWNGESVKLELMEDAAKVAQRHIERESIAFAEWATDNFKRSFPVDINKEVWSVNGNSPYQKGLRTTTELFKIYQEETK